MEDLYKGLDYVYCFTFEVFELYGISTKEVLSYNKYCVIDLAEKRIVISYKTRKACLEYIAQVTNRVVLHRKVQALDIH